MENTTLFPDQISRERFLQDMEAARPHLDAFTTASTQNTAYTNAINTQVTELDKLTPIERLKTMKWFLLAIPVLYYLADIWIDSGLKNGGTPNPIAVAFGVGVYAYIGLCIFLWFKCQPLYRFTKDYKKQLVEIEAKREEQKKIIAAMQKEEKLVLQHLYYVPGKYLYAQTLYKLESFMRNNGAQNLAQAINMYDLYRQNKN